MRRSSLRTREPRVVGEGRVYRSVVRGPRLEGYRADAVAPIKVAIGSNGPLPEASGPRP